MSSINTTATGHRTAIHTEVRAPIEVVISRIVWFVFGAIDVLIALRFALLLLGANAQAGFVEFIYGLSGVFMAPFVAVFGTARVQTAMFEWSALLAIAIYTLLAWGITALIEAVVPRQAAETVERTEAHDDTDVRSD